MMPKTTARSKLHVEGVDDKHSIKHLINHYGIDSEANELAPSIEDIGSVEQLLEGIETAVRVSGGRAIGFVLDADEPLTSRWASVRQRLVNAGVNDVPVQLPEDGFIGLATKFNSRVGVWFMPDNSQDGTLETFLRGLIDGEDPIITHAESSTNAAKTLGARFEDKDRLKAVIHTWLAWQKDPGRPYGVAIRAKYFRHDSPTAIRFVHWFERLYGLATTDPELAS